MRDWRHFPNAPITEALLDIRAELAPSATLRTLRGMHDAIRDHYPNRRERKKWEGTVEIKEGKLKFTQPPGQIDGYLFVSGDGREIVQARLDGFTFNRLRPYDRWETLRETARAHWRLYRDIARPTHLTRLALRYINRLELPLPLGDFAEYLKTIPNVADGIPQSVRTLFVRLEVPSEKGAIGIITQSLQAPEKRSDGRHILPFIFDIDVFKEERFPAESDEVWQIFEELRDFKNQIFFQSITPRAEELFQ